MDPDFDLSPADVGALQSRPWRHAPGDAVFHIGGPGAIDCLQGIFTNDLVKAGPQALTWGAFLTAKGMIITDAWIRRDGASAWLIVPAAAREVVRQLLARSFPPRLARVTERSDVEVAWLVHLAGRDLETLPGATVPYGPAPFDALVLLEGPDAKQVFLETAEAAGWTERGEEFSRARKVLVEWPTLGREIDEKTLVQEVRFDELQGVKYDKGCFTGQETVARLHFRGHANRELRRITLAEIPAHRDIVEGGKTVGRLTTWGRLGDELTALAVVRKKG